MDNDNDLAINNDDADQGERETVAQPTNLPLIITLVALITYFGFQTFSLIAERGNLGQVKSSQENALQEAQKIQAQFRTIVTKTGELAEKGHAGAKLVMEGLQRQGMGAAPAASPATKVSPSEKSVAPTTK